MKNMTTDENLMAIQLDLELSDFRSLVETGRVQNKTLKLGPVPVDLTIQLENIPEDQMLIIVQRTKIDLIERHELMDQDVFLKTITAMETYGGSFVKQLAIMALRSDPVNRMKCLLTWTDYFIEYSRHSEPEE